MHVTIDTAAKIIREQKEDGKSFAMVSGCFDLFHRDHLTFLNFAKKQADYVIVTLENDKTIARTKGEHRPVMKYPDRVELLRGIRPVDLITTIDDVYHFDDDEAQRMYQEVRKKLGVEVLISNKAADRYWQLKKKSAEELGIKFAALNSKTQITTTDIIERVKKEK